MFAVIISKSFRGVIFDLDGTLVDSSGEIAEALEDTFAELGLAPLPRKKVEALIGKGVGVLIERALHLAGAADRDHGKALERFEMHYARTVGTSAELYADVLEGLDRLRHADIPLAVVTNKPRTFTERLLDRLHVRSLFAAIVAGDDGIERKPAGDMLLEACRRMGTLPGETLMLGDSDNDVAAARAAGCPVWCVPYGYNEGRGPETLTCDRLVPTIAEAAREILA